MVRWIDRSEDAQAEMICEQSYFYCCRFLFFFLFLFLKEKGRKTNKRTKEEEPDNGNGSLPETPKELGKKSQTAAFEHVRVQILINRFTILLGVFSRSRLHGLGREKVVKFCKQCLSSESLYCTDEAQSPETVMRSTFFFFLIENTQWWNIQQRENRLRYGH